MSSELELKDGETSLGIYDLVIHDCCSPDEKSAEELHYLDFNLTLPDSREILYKVPCYSFCKLKRPLDGVKIEFILSRGLINWRLFKPGGYVEVDI